MQFGSSKPSLSGATGPSFEIESFTSKSISLRALTKIESAKTQSITIGGLRNPRTFKPTGEFFLVVTDSDNNEIAKGSLGSAQMNKVSEYNTM